MRCGRDEGLATVTGELLGSRVVGEEGSGGACATQRWRWYAFTALSCKQCRARTAENCSSRLPGDRTGNDNSEFLGVQGSHLANPSAGCYRVSAGGRHSVLGFLLG